MRIELEGMEELAKKLEQMGSQSEKIRNEAVGKGADILVSAVKEIVPERTGNLKGSITKSDYKDGIINVGPSAKGFHGRFLEFGTRKMSARPFMAPAFERNKAQIEQEMAKTVKRGLGL